MTRIRPAGLMFVSVLVLGAFAVTAAQATMGPYGKVNGATLKEGEVRTLKSTVKEKFELAASTQKVTCTGTEFLGVLRKLKLKLDFLGVIHFTGCTTSTNGANCNVTGGTILTNTVVGLFGYAGPARTGPILVLVKPDSGKVFVVLHFSAPEGSSCTFSETAVEGTTVGEAFVAGKALEVGGEVETLKGELKFTKAANKAVWVESDTEEATKENKAALKAFGVAASLSGIAVNEVEEGGSPVKWGVFTT